jgi:SRSO17 transposase
VRDQLRAYVVEQLGAPDAVWVVDETGFLKQGTKAVGVQRQYSGTAGRIENCQIGVFLAYASAKGRTFLDRELYLPKEWAADRERRQEAAVPAGVAFRTKPQLAQAMLERALDAGVPGAWVTGDEGYGGDRRLRLRLEARQVPHVLAIKSTEPLWTTTTWTPVAAATLAAGVPAAGWERLSAGDGAKGPRVYDWTRVPIRPLREPGWDYWLLVRRSLTDPTDLVYYVCSCPAGTRLAELVRVAGTRWAIEESFESAKGEVGLDHYEVRRWPGWYRHITLALLAHAYLTVTRAQAVEKGEAKRTTYCH